ncbi:NAD-dependent epimerase/dehydratase family protein, partial [Janibacter melonis]|uniref:NAD-dependent epimerase/dehydratase family protein n=1 Tax=Janibacter melonis TaxID=262209 RepID=UPI00177ABF43
MRVVVTGGLGALGSQVVHHLEQDGHEAVVASRRSGVDLEAGIGLDPLLAGTDAVVHTADTTSPRRWRSMTVGGTRAVLDAARRAGTPHVVTISIVGCERV